MQSDGPRRIQRKRTKGWRMPEGAINCTRSGNWGNPFIINPHVTPGSRSGGAYICVPTREDAVECFREMMKQRPDLIEAAQRELAGHDLACWCKVGDPCHADVLLELANAVSREGAA